MVIYGCVNIGLILYNDFHIKSFLVWWCLILCGDFCWNFHFPFKKRLVNSLVGVKDQYNMFYWVDVWCSCIRLQYFCLLRG